MPEIKNIYLLDDVPGELIDKLEEGAQLHRRFSGIIFKIKEYDDKKAVIQVAQAKHQNEKYFDKKRLIEIVHETFDPFLQKKIHVQPIPYVASPVESVTAEWIRNKMEKTGTKLKDIVDDTGLNKTQLSPMINGSKPISQISKALFYFYFLSKQ